MFASPPKMKRVTFQLVELLEMDRWILLERNRGVALRRILKSQPFLHLPGYLKVSSLLHHTLP